MLTQSRELWGETKVFILSMFYNDQQKVDDKSKLINWGTDQVGIRLRIYEMNTQQESGNYKNKHKDNL